MKPGVRFSAFGSKGKAPPQSKGVSEPTPSSSSTAPSLDPPRHVAGGVWGDQNDPKVWEQIQELSTKPFSHFEEEAKRQLKRRATEN